MGELDGECTGELVVAREEKVVISCSVCVIRGYGLGKKRYCSVDDGVGEIKLELKAIGFDAIWYCGVCIFVDMICA